MSDTLGMNTLYTAMPRVILWYSFGILFIYFLKNDYKLGMFLSYVVLILHYIMYVDWLCVREHWMIHHSLQ
jgi:hypothetical protein